MGGMTKNKALEEVKDQLEKGIREVMTSENFQEWLRFIASFHQYSFNNTILIYCQRPMATTVKGFNEWKKDGRFIRKGEKAIKILAPLIRKKNDEKKQGEEKKELYGFRCVSVFDVAQTHGKELPTSPVEILEDGGQMEEILLQGWIEKIDIPVRFENTGQVNGYFHLKENVIAIHQDRNVKQQLKTLIHEYAHYLLHAKGAPFEQESSRIREAQAEAVAYVVMNHFGYDTGKYSFGYIAGWSQDLDIMRKIGSDIVKCSHQIIERFKAKTNEKVIC
jgi:hypothetical protein